MALITLGEKSGSSAQPGHASGKAAGHRHESKRSKVNQRNPDPIQKAFQDGYADFVGARLKRIESNWSRMGDSLNRMEKKLREIIR